jgi:hypothetical protein
VQSLTFSYGGEGEITDFLLSAQGIDPKRMTNNEI